ncbi:MAG: FGGY family carbohydrate kinase, partial [Actinobacteria bacterium]|nr:FGGY family carbohydrate kinase [Actinomycetota bacterium]
NRFNSYMNKIEKNMDKLIRKLSGGYPFGPGKMLWIKNDFPGFYKRIRKFINLTTYVAGKLCKLNSDKAFIDKSCLTFFGLADVVKGKWNMDVCIQLGISIEKLPKICRPFEIIGNINRSIFGTEKDINVMVGCGDQVAGFLGSGIINNNNIVDVTGTYTVLGHCTKEFKSDLKNKVFSVIDSGIDDIFYQIAVIAAGGYTYRWFIEKFNYKPALNFENYKGTKGLYFIPYIGGRYHPVQPYYDGTWLGINWDHVLDDFYVSLLESFGYEFRFYLNLLKEISGSAGIDFKDIKVIGGGAKNNLWNNIKANILNLKYQRLNSLPFEIIGIFLIAKYGNNLKSGFQKLINDKIIFTDEIIEPIKEKILFYERNMENYIKIINGLDKVYSSIKS